MQDKSNDLQIDNIIQEIVKNQTNDALKSIGIEAKVDILLFPEGTNSFKFRELFEGFPTKMLLIMNINKIIRKQIQKVMVERDSAKCSKCYPNNTVKKLHHINLSEVKN